MVLYFTSGEMMKREVLKKERRRYKKRKEPNGRFR